MRYDRRVYGPLPLGIRHELANHRHIGDGAVSSPAQEMIPGTPRAGFDAMHKTIALAAALPLTACIPRAQFDVVQSPAGRSAEQQTLDTTQCSRKQQVSGPWVDGLGSLIIHDIARDGYSDCMKSLGYVVRERE
jgi:hypothetical protein